MKKTPLFHLHFLLICWEFILFFCKQIDQGDPRTYQKRRRRVTLPPVTFKCNIWNLKRCVLVCSTYLKSMRVTQMVHIKYIVVWFAPPCILKFILLFANFWYFCFKFQYWMPTSSFSLWFLILSTKISIFHIINLKYFLPLGSIAFRCSGSVCIGNQEEHIRVRATRICYFMFFTSFY